VRVLNSNISLPLQHEKSPSKQKLLWCSTWHSTGSICAVLLSVLVCYTFPAVAKSEQKEYPLRIKVVQSQSAPFTTTSNGGSSTNCTYGDSTANCNTTSNDITWRHVQNTMLVEASDGKVYTLGCTASVRWSKCRWLRVGDIFPARWDNHGLAVLYHPIKGGKTTEKEQETVYVVLGSRLLPDNNAGKQIETAPPPTVSPSATSAQSDTTGAQLEITSNPSGAEISVDDNFVGDTPSELAVAAGVHTITIAKHGYKPWERKLTVSSGKVTVAAELEQ
jgi:hypothetical protein